MSLEVDDAQMDHAGCSARAFLRRSDRIRRVRRVLSRERVKILMHQSKLCMALAVLLLLSPVYRGFGESTSRLIAVLPGELADQANVYAIDVQTGAAEMLLTLPSSSALVSLSPRSDMLSYVTPVDDGQTADGKPKLRVSGGIFNIATGRQQEIIDNGASVMLSTLFSALIPTVWSPDGSQVAFVDTVDSKRVISVTSVDSMQTHILASSLTPIQEPLWSSDGTLLLYFSESIPRQVVILSTDGSTPEHILSPLSQDTKLTYVAYGWIPGTHNIVLAPIENSNPTKPINWLSVNVDTEQTKALPQLDALGLSRSTILSDGTAFIVEVNPTSARLQRVDLTQAGRQFTPIDLGDQFQYGKLSVSPDQNWAAVSVHTSTTDNDVLNLIDLKSWRIVKTVPAERVLDTLWTPDSTQMIYAANPHNSAPGIFALGVQSEPHRLTSDLIMYMLGWTNVSAS